ncbi:MAG: hypothetical protein ACLQNE_44245 [Thermoguttaceae bacterium]
MSRSVTLVLALALLSGCKSSEPTTGPVDPFFGRTRVPAPPTGAIARDSGGDPSYNSARSNPLRGTSDARSVGLPAAVDWRPPQPQAGKYPLTSPSPPANPPPAGTNPSAASAAGTSGSLASDRPGDRIVIPLAARDMSRAASNLAAGSAAEPSRTTGARTGSLAGTATASPSATPGATGNTGRNPIYGLAERDSVTRVLPPRPKEPGGGLRNAPVPLDLPGPEDDSPPVSTAEKDTPRSSKL